MDTQHGDLSVDHVRCDVVQPFTPEKDKPRLVVSKYEHDRVFKYFECVENVSSVPFIDEVTILEFDSSGKRVHKYQSWYYIEDSGEYNFSRLSCAF